MRPVQFMLRDQWSQSSDPPLLPVHITPELLPVLRWWSLSVNLTSGVPLHQPLPDLRLFTDASSEGWGAHLLSHQTGPLGLGPETSAHQRSGASGRPPGPAALPAPYPGPASNGYDDNTTVVAQLRNQGGMLSRPLYSHTAQLLLWADSHNVSLVPCHIPGKLNVIADRLSCRHQVLNSEWTLSLPVLHQVWHLWGQPHVDVFATANNTRLPTFVSPLPDPAGVADQHLILHLDGPLDLPVSSVPSCTGSSTAHKSHSLPGDSDCPSVAVPALVSPAAETSCRPAT